MYSDLLNCHVPSFINLSPKGGKVLEVGNNMIEPGIIEIVLVQGSNDPVLSLVLLLTSCVTLDKSLSLSVSVTSYVRWGYLISLPGICDNQMK